MDTYTSVSGAASATFVYDGDGNRVKGTVNGTTTTYLGNYFEWTGSTTTMNKYYYAGATRVAMRHGSSSISWLFSDHLGSMAITATYDGTVTGELRYTAWGETRYTYGTTPTTYQYTGQRQEADLGIYYYGARWYDPLLGRFLQADTMVPAGVQGMDRYVYVNNNPLRYTDPSGHATCDADGNCDHRISPEMVLNKYGVVLSGTWSQRDKVVIMRAVGDVASQMGNVMGVAATDAFQDIYGGVNITNGLTGANEYCTNNMGTAGGCTSSAHQINFAHLQQETVSGGGIIPENIAFMSARNNVVHELGHAFADLWYKKDGSYDNSGPLGRGQIPGDLTVNEAGFAPTPDPFSEAVLMWRQHPGDLGASEIFADMFLGWTYNTWDSPSNGRSAFMNDHMAEWLK